MKLDPAIQKVVVRIAQEFKKLRQQIATLTDRVNSLAAGSGSPGPKGDKGDPGTTGPAGPAGPAGATGGSYLTYDIALTDAPATITDGFSTTVVLPAPPTVTGKTFTGIRIIRDSRAAVNITATAGGSFTSAIIMEYPIIHVYQVVSSLVGFVPFYNYRRIHVAGGYTSGGSTGVLSVEHSSEVKLRAADFTPDGVESITLTDLGHYLPDYVEDNVALTWGAGSERVWERLRLEYEYAEPVTALSVSEATTDETVNELAVPPVANVDGVITLTVSGGTGPYSMEVNGVGVVASGASPLVYSGLAGGDYEYKVRDSMGAVYPASGWQTIHVYREAFTAYINDSRSLALGVVTGVPSTRTMTFNQYDDVVNIGTVTAVELYSLSKTIRSTARIENTSGSGGTATTTVTGSFDIEYPAATVVHSDTITVLPLWSNSLTAYDGLADYGGTSGVSNSARSYGVTVSPGVSLTPSGFIGAGTVAINFTSSASGSVSGVSPYLLSIFAELGYTLTLRYTVSSARV